MAKLNIFGIPRAWHGIHEIRQINALESWVRLDPRPNIFLFGDESGTGEVAREFGTYYVPEIERSDNGIPNMGDIFRTMQAMLPSSILCYMNCDEILPPTFSPVVEYVIGKYSQEPFLAIGRRIDIEVNRRIDFDGDWQSEIMQQMQDEGTLHAACAIDYFVFKSGMYLDMPDLYIGCPAWDNWVVLHALDLKAPVIDISNAVQIVHQHKDNVGQKGRDCPEWHINRGAHVRLREKMQRNGFISDATFRLEAMGEENAKKQ